jgi:hypothetical protein
VVENVESILIEKIGENFDSIIDPLLGRNIVKRDKETISLLKIKNLNFILN